MARNSTQHVSLQPVEKLAARLLADRLDRGNTSQFIARLIRRAAKEEIGADWEVIVSQSTEKEDTAA